MRVVSPNEVLKRTAQGDIIAKVIVWLLISGLGAFIGTHSEGANAKELTVSDLQHVCNSQGRANDAECGLYILGVVQGITIGMQMADGKFAGGRPCVPDNIPLSKLEPRVKAELGWDLKVFPEDKNKPASTFIGAFIASNFPCDKAH